MRNEALFLQILKSGQILFLDGAMGTMLQAAGMPAGSTPEKFCLDNPEILKQIHIAYLQAGSNIITACSFGANRFKLPDGMKANVYDINRQMALLAREAVSEANVEGPVFIAGDVGPTGHFVKPLGDVEPAAIQDAYAEQIRGLAAGGVDIVFMETQFDLAEIRLAVAAAHTVCDLPIMVSMTFEAGKSLTGTSPQIYAETMLNQSIDILGTNCSLGPDEMLPVVRDLLAVSTEPIVAQPNAGLPELRNGKTIFPLGPDDFAEKTAQFAKLGAKILGGCCGTTPAHIKALINKVRSMEIPTREIPKSSGICLTSRSQIVHIGKDFPFVLIGERINPTGRPSLAHQLQEGKFSEALCLADEQISAGASMLDVNVGAPMVDEAILLPDLVNILSARYSIPLSLDSSTSKAIAAAMPLYPGSCLVNSISGEADKMEILGPLCRTYGSPFILLPIAGSSLPATARERIAIVEKLLRQAEDLAIPKRLVLIDILALAISSSPDSTKECMEMIRWCANNGYPTTAGLSNISFGLPARELLNSVFLCMANGSGLSSCIANPGSLRLREAIDALNVLAGHDTGAMNFIGGYANWKKPDAPLAKNVLAKKAETLYDTILLGDKENVVQRVEEAVARGEKPMDIVNGVLIPAITEVGERYGRKEYFLPQLVRSAETMQLAFKTLKPLLEQAGSQDKKPVIVMATVEGDIHDIGKNIVCLMLGNHGFEVIDAGKDVPAADIVACAERHNASIIGLSALMTTTMTRMADTISLVREKNLPIRIMVGGAAVTPSFAESIGADAYCEDAVESVHAARSFVS